MQKDLKFILASIEENKFKTMPDRVPTLQAIKDLMKTLDKDSESISLLKEVYSLVKNNDINSSVQKQKILTDLNNIVNKKVKPTPPEGKVLKESIDPEEQVEVKETVQKLLQEELKQVNDDLSVYAETNEGVKVGILITLVLIFIGLVVL